MLQQLVVSANATGALDAACPKSEFLYLAETDGYEECKHEELVAVCRRFKLLTRKRELLWDNLQICSAKSS